MSDPDYGELSHRKVEEQDRAYVIWRAGATGIRRILRSEKCQAGEPTVWTLPGQAGRDGTLNAGHVMNIWARLLISTAAARSAFPASRKSWRNRERDGKDVFKILAAQWADAHEDHSSPRRVAE